MEKIKKYFFHIIGFLFGLSFLFIAYKINDPSFYVLGFLFIFFPVIFNLFTIIKVPKIKINIKKNDIKTIILKNKQSHLLSIFIPSIILLLFFVVIGIYFLPAYTSSKYGLLQYYVLTASFLIQHWLITLVIILVALLVSIVRPKFSFNFKKILSFIPLLMSSYFASLVLILIISIINVLFTGVFSIVNPKLISIITNTDQIKEKVKNDKEIPTIIGADKNIKILIVEHSDILFETSEFYKKNILSSLPTFLYSPIRDPNSPIFLYKNYLVIKTIDKDAIQSIGPLIAKKIIQKSFDTKYIRDEPIVNVIGKQDYLKYRDDQFNEELTKIKTAINEINKQIRFANSKISEAKSSISVLQGYIVLNSQYRDSEYNQCISATNTYYGYYSNYSYRIYSDQYCNELRNNRNSQNQEYQNSIDQYSQNLRYYQNLAYSLNETFSDLDTYSKLVESSKSSTPYELGLFEPPNSIKIVLESTSSKAVGDFFATLAHEYLHYTSYISSERELPHFFEEGFTEYLSRNIINESLKINTNLGYPLITKIITILSSKIDKNILSQIYFTKDTDLLTTTLDSVYGKNFYKDTESYFTLIPYLPSDQALKLANNIMYRIDGPKLTETDLYSVESDYQK